MSIPEPQFFSFSEKEGRYLTYILEYTRLRGIPPAFADMQAYFNVAPPTVVNQMIKTLEKKGLIEKQPRKARSIRVTLPEAQLPIL